MNSDSSCVTTYSQDERIAQYLTEHKQKETLQAEEEDLERHDTFEDYYKEQINEEDSIFKLPGMNFLKFCHSKIKFKFQPYKVANVSKKIVFYCSLKYKNNRWTIRRNTFPVTHVWKIHSSFLRKSINDEQIIAVLFRICGILSQWSEQYEKFRRQRFQDYKNGHDIILDSEDEELFLNAVEIEEMHRKRNSIFSRMRTELIYEYREQLHSKLIKTRQHYK